MIGEEFKEPEKEKNMPKVAEKPVKNVRHDDDAPKPNSSIGSSIVLANVLNHLGRPHNMSPVVQSLTRATAVTQNQFRVNIYTRETKGGGQSKGIGMGSPVFTADELTHSFFVKVNEKGEIVTSNPEIIKHYE